MKGRWTNLAPMNFRSAGRQFGSVERLQHRSETPRCTVRLCVHYEAPSGWFVSDDGDFARLKFLPHDKAKITSKRMGKRERIFDFEMYEFDATDLGFDRCA